MRCAALPCVLALVLTWIAAAKGKGGRTDCARQSYRKNVLKLVKVQRDQAHQSRAPSSPRRPPAGRRSPPPPLRPPQEAPFAGLFRDVKNHTKFEASGVAAVRGHFYAVFDNSFALGRLDERFSFRGPDNALVGEMRGESQYEGIAYVPEKDTFLLLQEAAPAGRRGASTFRPAVVEVRLRADGAGYDQLARCDVDFELSHGNKGFESIAYLHTASGEAFLLGLCEGNFCRGGRDGADAGNGRIIVTRLRQGGEGGCAWEPVKSLHIPPGAHFRDYAAMAFNFAAGKLAILSQEDAAIWVSLRSLSLDAQRSLSLNAPRRGVACLGPRWRRMGAL
jgi:hypothetical protein